MKESVIIGTLLAEYPSALPSHIAKLIEHAPESFDDPQLGLVAKAIRDVKSSGKPVHVLSVRDSLPKDFDLSFIGFTAVGAIAIDLAEYEAETVWKAYHARRVRILLDEGGKSLDSRPEQFRDVAERVKAELERLEVSDNRNSWQSRLRERAFDFDHEPAPLAPVYSLCGNAVSTSGNLTSIVSQAKTGKSAVIGSMIAATMAPAGSAVDLLGFTSSNDKGGAVLHFDTEQSPDDSWHVVARAIRRADVFAPPPWLASYCLTGLLPREAWQAVQEGLRLAADKFGGIHSVLIDGVGDLVHDVNDAGECNDFVAALHGLAITHSCPIIGVLHFNPDSAKARGHLGSQIERKSESNLRLDKEEDFTVLWSNKQRRAAIGRDFGPRFTWSDEAGMHVTVESRSQARRSAQAEAEIPHRDDAFNGRSAMRYNELIEALKTTVKCSDRTAQRRVDKWRKLAVIEKNVAGLWITKD